MATAEKAPAEQRFLLYGIPWQTYLALRDVPENYHVRMTYDGGVLEMMSPSKRHEKYAEMIGLLIHIWAMELHVGMESCRTMTFKREDLEKGLEPDNCYYVQNEPLVWQKDELDLAVDPPPDLAVEVELRRNAIGKMPLYAAFGVPEVWRYDGRNLRVFELGAEGKYVPRESSVSFPELPIAEVQRVLRRIGSEHETALVCSFRDWVRKEVLAKQKGGHDEPGQTA